MNSYITLDGKKYNAPHKRWNPATGHKPSSVKPTLMGEIDVTYGSVNILEWKGEIEGPVTAPTGWGTIGDLRTALYTRTGLTFVDHYGTTRTIHAIGPFPERSNSPMWDASSNKIYISVTFLCEES